MLFEEYEIDKYYGVDISNRSLMESDKRLKKFVDYELLDVGVFYDSFLNKEVDIFISQAVIQHFPNKEYLDNFLHKLKVISPKIIMLQIAYNEDNLFIANNDYNSIDSVVRACHTNSEYLNSILKYSIEYESHIHGNNYQFIIFNKPEE